MKRIFASCFDAVCKTRRPALVKPTGSRRARVVADLLLNPRFAKDRLRFAQVEAEDIGRVHARVESDRARVLHMSPGSDGDAIAPTDSCLHHQTRLSDHAITNERPSEPIDWITAIVFSD
jgi:hypothetical protein